MPGPLVPRAVTVLRDKTLERRSRRGGQAQARSIIAQQDEVAGPLTEQRPREHGEKAAVHKPGDGPRQLPT